jgi:hypothetical protein
MVGAIPGLPFREAIAFGAVLPVPVRIRTIDANPTPRLTTAPFVTEWKKGNGAALAVPAVAESLTPTPSPAAVVIPDALPSPKLDDDIPF